MARQNGFPGRSIFLSLKPYFASAPWHRARLGNLRVIAFSDLLGLWPIGQWPRQASPPVFFAAPGTPSSRFFPSNKPREWSAARRFQPDHALRGVCVLGEGRAPRGAPSRLFCPRDRASGCRRVGSSPALIRAAFAALRPHRVQPSKAAGPRAGGRLPEASRERGYEPRPQAPHPLPLSERLMTTPSEGEDR